MHFIKGGFQERKRGERKIERFTIHKTKKNHRKIEEEKIFGRAFNKKEKIAEENREKNS